MERPPEHFTRRMFQLRRRRATCSSSHEPLSNKKPPSFPPVGSATGAPADFLPLFPSSWPCHRGYCCTEGAVWGHYLWSQISRRLRGAPDWLAHLTPPFLTSIPWKKTTKNPIPTCSAGRRSTLHELRRGKLRETVGADG